MNEKPDKSMRLVRKAVDFDNDVPILKASGNISGASRLDVNEASNDARVGIVSKKFAHSLRGKMVPAHAVALLCNGLGSDAYGLNTVGVALL